MLKWVDEPVCSDLPVKPFIEDYVTLLTFLLAVQFLNYPLGCLNELFIL